MPAYLIANVDVRDPAGYERYRVRTREIVEQYGGRFLVRGGKMHVLEGEPEVHRLVVLEFLSSQAAQAFYDSREYQAIVPFRTANAATTMFIVEGWDP